MSTIIQNFRILTITNFLLKEASESLFFTPRELRS